MDAVNFVAMYYALFSAVAMYYCLQLLGVDVFYAARLLVSRDMRARRRLMQGWARRVLMGYVYTAARLVGVDAPRPCRVRLRFMLRRSCRPGGRYFWGRMLVVVDEPCRLRDLLPVLAHEAAHLVQDVAGLRDRPRWLLEGMAAAVELYFLRHVPGYRLRGYTAELLRWLGYCLERDDPLACPCSVVAAAVEATATAQTRPEGRRWGL